MPGVGYEEMRVEIVRLRARTHEIQAEESRRNAALQREVDRYRNDTARARELVSEVKADWTADPPSQAKYGWWRYASENSRLLVTELLREAAVIHRLEVRDYYGPTADCEGMGI